MSKKHKITKKISNPVPERSSENKPTPVLRQSSKKGTKTGISLILFDNKTKIFLGLLLLTYIILSSLKIHTSNIANWDLFFGLEKSESVIAGKPRFIRMDEWMISSPSSIGQYNAGLPIKNESVGDYNTPIVWGLPVKDVSTIFRPNFWSYFIFDLERAFAFSWNFNVFFFLITTFLVFMLLTKNQFWLSVVGTFFIFLSGGIQWWSYYIGNSMLYLNGMFVSAAYLLYNKNKWPLIISGLILITSVCGFIFGLYPPFQVPLVYLYLFLFIGFLWERKNFNVLKEALSFKISVLLGILVILGIVLFHYYTLAKEAYSAMLNTVYPGHRFSTGGELIEGKLFSEFFGMFMNDTHLPNLWMNICEASGFIMFFPILFYGMGYYFVRSKKTDPLLLAIAAYVIVTLIYVLVGFPAFISKATLFSMSPDFRTLPILGVANCFLLFCYLSSKKNFLKNETISWIELGILAIVTFLFIELVAARINKLTTNFFTRSEVTIAVVLTTISYLLIRYKNFRFATPVLYVILLSLVIGNITVNPFTKGLSPITENPLYIASSDIYKKDPKSRWALFGNVRISHLLKAAGVNMFNCVKMVPPIRDLRVLDPKGQSDSTYNRYAWMTMQTFIDGRDTAVFRQTFNDSYTIFIDPCSPKLKQLNVKYFVFDHTPKTEEIRCMTKLTEVAGLFIYKRNDFN